MPEDTSTSTFPSACLVLMHRDTCMSVRMRRSQVLRHLVLLCVELHGTASCTSTPHSFDDTQQVKWLTPRPDLLDQATSSFSVDLRDFGSSGEFSSRDQSRIFFRFRSDELNILIESKLSLTLRIKISKPSVSREIR